MSRKHNNEHWRDVNVHHKIGVSNRSRANVQEDCNKMLINVIEHNGLNSLFHDKQSPQEQLEHCVNYIWKGTISREAEILFETLLAMPKDRFYKKELIKCLKNSNK